MSQLILQTLGGQPQAFALRSGVNFIGSKPGNQIQIADASISGVHAQIVVEGDCVLIQDRESTNGTQVNGQMIFESELAHGDHITLGNVNLMFEAGDPAEGGPVEVATTAAAPPTADAQPAFVGEVYCRNHPHNLVHYHCPQCQKHFCDLCVAGRHEGESYKHFCRACGSECAPVRSAIQPRKSERFGTLLGRAFSYPFHGNGPVLLLTGTLFLIAINVVLFIARFAFALGLIAVIITVLFGGGYLFSYIKAVVLTSATGSDDMPDWPDFTEWGSDVLVPFFQMLGLFAVSFGPAWVLFSFRGENAGPTGEIAAVALVFLGIVYLPMALLGLCMCDGMMGVNPALVIPSIFKVFGHYLLALCVVIGAASLAAGSKWLLARLIPIPILPAVIGQAIGFYSMVAEARVLGVLYRANAGRLGWFKHRRTA